MRRFHITSAIFAGLALGSVLTNANAHPGHGEPGPSHYFNEPAHAIPLLILGLIAAFLVSGWHKTKTGKPSVKA